METIWAFLEMGTWAHTWSLHTALALLWCCFHIHWVERGVPNTSQLSLWSGGWGWGAAKQFMPHSVEESVVMSCSKDFFGASRAERGDWCYFWVLANHRGAGNEWAPIYLAAYCALWGCSVCAVHSQLQEIAQLIKVSVSEVSHLCKKEGKELLSS